MSGNVVNEASSAYHSDAKRALMTTDQGHAAFHCQECDDDAPTWRIRAIGGCGRVVGVLPTPARRVYGTPTGLRDNQVGRHLVHAMIAHTGRNGG